MVDRDTVREAIENAAGAGMKTGLSLSPVGAPPATAKRIAKVRNIIKRFLEIMPEDASVMEIREAMDQ